MADYNTKKAQLLELIENELRDNGKVRRSVLYYKAWKRYGFSEKIVDKAIQRLLDVNRAMDNGLGEVFLPQ